MDRAVTPEKRVNSNHMHPDILPHAYLSTSFYQRKIGLGTRPEHKHFVCDKDRYNGCTYTLTF